MRIKELRLEKNKTQNEIATILGISRQVFANYEKEINYPDPNMLIKLADYFDVSIDFLVERSDDFGNITTKKIPSEDFTAEEIEMIKKIRELGLNEQIYIKAQIDALSDTQKSKQKEKI